MSFARNESATTDAVAEACENLESTLQGFAFEFTCGRSADERPDAILIGYAPNPVSPAVTVMRTLSLDDAAAAIEDGDGIEAALREQYDTCRTAWEAR